MSTLEIDYFPLVVDSEGIGAFNEDQNHDTRIFFSRGVSCQIA